ncbi:MAG TPA: ABC transporter permease [Kouleothrix sp.]|uniref:ABC transporter permease n=1 Tax=Kouleothrix sp. TaxID=2779161 RepID=UPI002C57C143|nr:ABC transporter permease [Kouleothrix sp.]HRC75753.1 ABC transporter permease [Kouleothrix sp.]
MATTTTAPAASAPLTQMRAPESLWRQAIRAFFRQRSAVIGLTIIVLLVLVALLAPLLAPYNPEQVLIGIEDVQKRAAPCIHLLGCAADQPQHIMGTDGNNRDEWSRIIYGARVSLYVGFLTVGFAIILGVLLGALAGYVGGWVDNLIMRVLDVLLAFPALLLAIAIVSVLGPGLINAMLAIAIVSIPAYARVMRASVLAVKQEEYVAAARVVGASPLAILLQHVMPNAISPLIVQGTLGIGTAILETAALSFLGLGAQPPTPEWGSMLSAERNQVFSAPHLVFFPGLAIMVNVLGFNLLGDGLRDALDPRLRR